MKPKSKWDGGLLGIIGWTILGSIVTTVTLGILYPVAEVWLIKYFARHAVIDGKRLYFDGNGFQLVGKWILWEILSIITFGIYGLWVPVKMIKWITKHIHQYEYIEEVEDDEDEPQKIEQEEAPAEG